MDDKSPDRTQKPSDSVGRTSSPTDGAYMISTPTPTPTQRVAELRAQIARGAYAPDPGDVATALLVRLRAGSRSADGGHRSN